MMTTNEDAGLLPCPFCSSTNCSLSMRVGAWKFAYCPDCLTEGPAMDNDSDAIAAWNRRAPSKVQVEAVRADPVSRLLEFHGEQLSSNPYCYFELAYTRQTDWMAWITDRPAQGEPGTAAYARSRKVTVRGQGSTAQDACADALAALAAASGGEKV